MIQLKQSPTFASLRPHLPAGIDTLTEVPAGEHGIADRLPLYATVGAAVAVCLIDRSTGIVGLCHVLLPDRYGGHREDALLKADSALEALGNALHDAVQARGARAQLQAKFFGGASTERTAQGGTLTAAFCRNWLNTHRLPIVAEALAGHQQREIVLLPESGAVFCRQGPLEPALLAAERAALLDTAPSTPKIELF